MKIKTLLIAALCGLASGATLAAPGANPAPIPNDGSILPFSPTPSASVAGPTLQESTHQRRAEDSNLPADAPNILIILLDDVGFSLPDTYGGPIYTPTRAALLTGRNHQRVGSGHRRDLAQGAGRLRSAGPFDDGWDALRERTFARQKALATRATECSLVR